jgi:hypothetical protein
MKKILLSVVILCLFLANSLAEQTITCKKPSNSQTKCEFSGVTIGPNEAVSIKIYPADLDVKTITWVQFLSSSIHSVPREIFTKFPNLKWLSVHQQNIQEIHQDTFRDGKKLEQISLSDNNLRFLHRDTFEGKNF